MLAFLLSMVPLFAYGISDYASSRLSKGLSPVAVGLAFSVVGLPITLVTSLVLGWPVFSLQIFLQFLAVSLIVSGGFYSMVHAFSLGSAGVVAPIANAYAVITLVFAVLFLDESVDLQSVAAVLIVVAGIALLSYTSAAEGKSHKNLYKTVAYSMVSTMLFGIGFGLFGVVAKQQWYQNGLMLQSTGFMVSLVLYLLLTKKDKLKTLSVPLSNKFSYMGGISGGLGTLGFFGAISALGSISVPASIAAGSPLVTALLARRYSAELLTRRQMLGAATVVIGVVALSL